MKRHAIVSATTHVDSHGFRFTKESLEQAAELMRGRYTPLLVEHDWLRPLGRITGGATRLREDGEWELFGIAEILEPGDADIPSDPEREFRVAPPEFTGVAVHVGNEFLRDPQSRAIVHEIETLLGKAVGFEGRRALEPQDLIKIVAVVALGQAAAGFFNALGADGYRALKNYIQRLFATRPEKATARQLCLDLFFDREGVEVLMIQSDPSAENVEAVLSNGLRELDLVLADILRDVPDVRRLVAEYGPNGLRIAYVLGKDCLPRAVERRDPGSHPV